MCTHVTTLPVSDVSKVLEIHYFFIWSYCKLAFTTTVMMEITEARASVSVALLVSCTVLAGGE